MHDYIRVVCAFARMYLCPRAGRGMRNNKLLTDSPVLCGGHTAGLPGQTQGTAAERER